MNVLLVLPKPSWTDVRPHRSVKMADGCGAAAEVARTLLGTETTRRIDKDTALTIIDGLVEPLRKKATECGLET